MYKECSYTEANGVKCLESGWEDESKLIVRRYGGLP
jgi:hypothetical protein